MMSIAPIGALTFATMIFMVLLAASSVRGEGIMKFDIFATRDANMTIRFGFHEMNIPVYARGFTHFAFNPVKATPDESLQITVGIVENYEQYRHILYQLTPGYTRKFMEFDNVDVIIHANYTCNNGLEGVRCAMKNVGTTVATPTTSSSTIRDDDFELFRVVHLVFCTIMITLVAVFLFKQIVKIRNASQPKLQTRTVRIYRAVRTPQPCIYQATLV